MFKYGAFLFLILPILASAGDESVGTTSANFLKIPPNARAAAMGEAFSALSDDESSLDYNPSGIARLLQDEVSATHIEWFQGIHLEHLGGVFGLGPLGAFGASLTWLQVDDLAETQRIANSSNALANYQVTGSFSPHDAALTLGYAYPLFDNFNLGANLRFIQQNIDTSNGYGVAVDLGGQWLNAVDGLDLGLLVKNVGTPVSVGGTSFAQPLDFGGGAAYHLGFASLPTVLSADLSSPTDNKMMISLGAESWIEEVLALRAGWRGGYANQITVGAGFRLAGFQLDYAWVPFDDLGATHRLTASYAYGAPSIGLGMDRNLIAPVGDEDKRIVNWMPRVNSPERIHSWSISLTDSRGDLVKTIEGRGPIPPKIPWNGRDEQGRPEPDGLVSATLHAVYDSNIEAKSPLAKVELDSTPPLLSFDVNPKIFRPGGQSAIMIPANFSLGARDKHGIGGWSMEVRNTDGSLFRAYSGQGNPPASLSWDGADTNGSPAQSNHSYIVRFFAKDSLGNKAQSQPLAEIVLMREIHFSVASDALFEPGKADVRMEAYQELKSMKEKILAYVPTGGTVEIFGHTDSSPVHASVYGNNQALSLARAQAVIKFFTTLLGMDPAMFKAVGMGDTKPIADNGTLEGQIKNRRVEIVVHGSAYQ